MNNNLLKSFLANPEMEELYRNYLNKPSEEVKQLIENHFRIHVKKIKILAYFSKILKFEAQRFDKKIRKISNSNILILDNDEITGGTTLYKDLNSNELECFEGQVQSAQQLENLFDDKDLYNIIAKLKPKNKELLYLLYVKEMEESEIAKRWDVTKQAVNKRKNSILHQIREDYIRNQEVITNGEQHK